ncbi:MAG: DUF892 family protein, partial [Solirubrobacteraceae bacterium]
MFSFELGSALTMEQKLVEVLEELEEHANRDEIKRALREHRQETRQHVTNIEQMLQAARPRRGRLQPRRRPSRAAAPRIAREGQPDGDASKRAPCRVSRCVRGPNARVPDPSDTTTTPQRRGRLCSGTPAVPLPVVSSHPVFGSRFGKPSAASRAQPGTRQ